MASIIDHNGIERKLGLLPIDEETKRVRASQPSFSDFAGQNGLTIYPRDQWDDLDNASLRGPEFVNDQRNCSGCVGWSAAGAEMMTRAARGMPFEKLSGAFVYAHINGGRDAGAMITHAMGAERQFGHCLESEFDYPKLYLNQIPDAVKQSALSRQSRMAYTINSLEEFFTAIMCGFYPQFGVCVGNNFNAFDTHGIAGVTSGYANHSVCAFGMKRFGSIWCAQTGNSWGKDWGPFRSGWCWINERAIRLDDAFVHVDAEFTGDQ